MPFSKKLIRFAILASLLATLQGCIVSGNTKGHSAADTPAFTASVNGEQDKLAESLPLADQTLIRNKVAKAGKQDPGSTLAWSNNETGNRGVISALTETEENGRPCRTFQTTRESYDGVLLFAGKTCKVSDNIWTMVDLKAL